MGLDLSRAQVRPARSKRDLARAVEFLKTARAEEVALGHPEERGAVRLCEMDGELVAALILDPSPLRLRDVDVRCARILETGGEDGRRRFRETGDRDLFVYVLEEALGYLWMKRYPIAFVHGELALYPAHGFVPCFYHPRIYLDVATALTLPAPYRVRHLKSDDAARLLELRACNRRWKPVVFAMGVPPFHHFCVENRAREVKGYVSLEARPDSAWNPPLFIPEVEVEDRAAARTILQHCAKQARRLGLEAMHFPLGPGHPVARLCLELGGHAVVKGAAIDPFLDEEMVHLVDPSLLVAELAPFFERRLASDEGRAVDAAIPIATGGGSWFLRIKEGRVSCTSLAEKVADSVELPQWQLTQLLAGYRGVTELDVDLTAAQEDVLRLILPKTWPYSLPDPDLWADVPPLRPYAPVAAAAVRETTLPWGQP
ncbi:MAG: hypothetical protein ACYTEZ_07885 [Planctomycetota bacterium]|jgi:hypothetical protein